MSNYRVIVRACDEYIAALKPFAWLFNKYWSPTQEVLVGGYTSPNFELPSNFTFHSIGAANLYPVSRWSDATIELLKSINDDAFVFMMEDWWLNMPVEIDAIQACIDEARATPNLLRIDLLSDRLYANVTLWHNRSEIDYKGITELPLIKSRWDTPYQLACAASVYRRDQFLKCLVPGWNPWQVELIGTNRMREWGEDAPIVLGTTTHLLNYANGMKQDPNKTKRGLRGKDAVMIETYDLVQSDYAEMKSLGLMP